MLRLIISVLAFLTAFQGFAQGVVTLRPVARVELGTPITLGDIAKLTGDAEALAGVVLIDSPADEAGADRRLDVPLKDIRAKLGSLPDFSAGQITFRGDACRIILRVRTNTDNQNANLLRPEVTAASVGITLRDHVESKLLQTFGVTLEHLQLSFDDSDAALLASSTEGWVVDVQPIGSSATMPMRITMYDEAGNIRDETVRVGVRILRKVVRTTRALRRGLTPTPEDYETDSAWLAPDIAYIEPEAVTTIRLRRNTGAGEMLTVAHAEQAEVIKKGEVVSVHVVSGTIVMRSAARALEAGRIGDTIEFEPLQGGGSFMAEVKAPGRAVVIANATHLTGAQR